MKHSERPETGASSFIFLNVADFKDVHGGYHFQVNPLEGSFPSGRFNREFTASLQLTCAEARSIFETFVTIRQIVRGWGAPAPFSTLIRQRYLGGGSHGSVVFSLAHLIASDSIPWRRCHSTSPQTISCPEFLWTRNSHQFQRNERPIPCCGGDVR